MRLFELRREEDESGVSGTGTVAQGVIFDTGWCALTWLTEHTSVAFYTSLDEVVAIHGHNGSTKVVQVADCDADRVQPLVQNCVQDHCENVSVDFFGDHVKKNHRYMWDQREKLVGLFDPKVLSD